LSTTLEAAPEASGGRRSRGRRSVDDGESGGTGRLSGLSLPRVLGSAWIPTVLMVAITALVLHYYAVPLRSIAKFTAYLVLGVVLPGTLLWRTLLGRSSGLVADAAAGAALGYTVEVLVYIAARWIGLPLLVLAWPIGMIAAALLIPALRRYWRSPPRERTPASWAWSMALVVGFFLFRSVRVFRSHGLQWPVSGPTDADTPFHWALIGEAKYHMPMQAPWVSGEPLVYHWFVYPDMAATSWVTGIDPLTLLVRLSPLPMMVAFLLLIAAIARRLTGLWWTGPVAAGAALLVNAPDPYGWRLNDGWFGFGAVEDGSVFRLTSWTSPTQTFGQLLFAALALLLVDILMPAASDNAGNADGAGRKVGAGRWVLLSILLAGVAGAKSPYLPMLTGALVATVVALWLARRGVHRVMLLIAAIVVAFTVVSQIVLYGGGSSQALVVQPLAIMGWYDSIAASMTGFATPDAPLWRLAVVAGFTILSWLFIWAGLGALVLRKRLLDPAVLLLVFIGLAGVGGVLLFGHPGGSQSYLIMSGRPYLALASIAGLAAALGGGAVRRTVAWSLVGAVAAGIATVLLVRLADGPVTPDAGPDGTWFKHLGWELTWPYLVLGAVVVVVALVLTVARVRVAFLRGTTIALLVCFCAGFGLTSAGDAVRAIAADTAPELGGWGPVPVAWQVGPDGRQSAVDRDTYYVGKWLQRHSGTDDLVATNVHCFGVRRPGDPCDNRRFALSAASQRRVLVESWGFTNSTYVQAAKEDTLPWFAGFWDEQRLKDNDAAFTAPSAQSVGVLRDRYGVRWLVVDSSVGGAVDLGALAVPRYHFGLCMVYELPR
jgi:hypothetical protein